MLFPLRGFLPCLIFLGASEVEVHVVDEGFDFVVVFWGDEAGGFKEGEGAFARRFRVKSRMTILGGLGRNIILRFDRIIECAIVSDG